MASDTSHLNRIVRFTQMKDGTREDYELLELHERDYLRIAARSHHARAESSEDRARRLSRHAPGAFPAGGDARASAMGRTPR
jgi:hypothetical protein